MSDLLHINSHSGDHLQESSDVHAPDHRSFGCSHGALVRDLELPEGRVNRMEKNWPVEKETGSARMATKGASVTRQEESKNSRAPQFLLSRGVSETKLVVPSESIDTILTWAKAHLELDQYCDPVLGNGYYVRTLYLDTPENAIFHRKGIGRHRKFRIRRYGTSNEIWLEMKWKFQGRIRKRRVSIPDQSIEEVLQNHWDETRWFSRRIARYDLQPSCQLSYERQAYQLLTPSGNLRLTLDRNLRVNSHLGWKVPETDCEGAILGNDCAILELKYPHDFPREFRDLLVQLKSIPQSFSKYRQGIKSLRSGQ